MELPEPPLLTDNEIVKAKVGVDYQALGIPLTYGVRKMDRSVAAAQARKTLKWLARERPDWHADHGVFADVVDRDHPEYGLTCSEPDCWWCNVLKKARDGAR